MQPEAFHDLIRRVRDGDAAAVERLLTLVRPWLDGLASRQADASDLAQEALLRTWQHLDQFQGGGDDATLDLFRAWLRRIVERIGLNTVRSRQAQRRRPPGPMARLDAATPPEPAAADTPPSEQAERAERERRVRQALDKLPDEDDRTLMRLRFFEGLSLRQIAVRFNRNFEQLRQQFHRVLRRLESDLKGLT
jgi:RNA polymerase sigma-70 factor (ECF subfamily)